MEQLLALAPAAFLGGIISFLSPCVLPLVPGYLCFAAGLQFQEMQNLAAEGKAARAIVPSAAAFVAGFSAVFIALGAAAAAINPLLIAHQLLLAQIAGGAIIILGLYIIGILPIASFMPFFAREMRFTTSDAPKLIPHWMLAFVMGLAFAFGWTPCIGPILASILALAATRESLGEGVILLALYAAGLGVPFMLAAFGVERFLRTSKRLARHGLMAKRIGGGVLVLTGFGVLSGRLQSGGAYLLDWFPLLGRLG